MLCWMEGPSRPKEPAALEDAVDDGVGEVVVTEATSPSSRCLFVVKIIARRRDVAVVDDVVGRSRRRRRRRDSRPRRRRDVRLHVDSKALRVAGPRDWLQRVRR